MLLGRLSRQALARVPWDTLLLLGGGFALAAGIEGGGLSTYMAARLEGLESQGPTTQYDAVALDLLSAALLTVYGLVWVRFVLG